MLWFTDIHFSWWFFVAVLILSTNSFDLGNKKLSMLIAFSCKDYNSQRCTPKQDLLTQAMSDL